MVRKLSCLTPRQLERYDPAEHQDCPESWFGPGAIQAKLGYRPRWALLGERRCCSLASLGSQVHLHISVERKADADGTGSSNYAALTGVVGVVTINL